MILEKDHFSFGESRLNQLVFGLEVLHQELAVRRDLN